MLLFPMIYYFCTHLDKHNDHEKQTIFYYSSHAAVSNIAICTIRHWQTIRSILSDRSYPLHRKLIGIAGYSSNLRNGIGWSGSYTYLVGNKPAIRAGFGILYQGSRYTGNTTNTTDKIQTHYFAPQFSLHWLKQQFDWYFTTGTGYQLYKDDSMVYDKPRKVSMNKWAANFGVGGEYHLFTHWGISARISYILAYSGEYSVRYHHKEWMVQPHYPMNGSDDISQLSFSAGINYHF